MYPKQRVNSVYVHTHTHLYTFIQKHKSTDMSLKETFHLVDNLILADKNNWEIFQEKNLLYSIPLTLNIEIMPYLIHLNNPPGVV